MPVVQPSNIYSFMHTRADIEILEEGKKLRLHMDGKNMYISLIGNSELSFIQMEAKGMTENVINMTEGAMRKSIAHQKAIPVEMVEIKGEELIKKIAICAKDVKDLKYAICISSKPI